MLRNVCLITALAFSAFGQASAVPVPTDNPQFILGSGAGFKPYQTPIKSGASAFIEGGAELNALGLGVAAIPGLYAFARVEMRPTDAQMIVEGCKRLFVSGHVMTLACGGPGFGADATNFGLSLAAGGKLFYQRNSVVLGLEIGVTKTTVPAPVTPAATISPVQPDFRIGIHKYFFP